MHLRVVVYIAIIAPVVLGVVTGCTRASPSHASPSSLLPASALQETPIIRATIGSTSSEVAPCEAATLGIRRGPRLSLATGEHGVIIAVSAEGSPCTVVGYPKVEFLAGDTPIPFTYQFGEGQYVSHRSPQPVTLGAGKVAYFLVAKYQCDLIAISSTNGMEVFLPRQGTTVNASKSWLVSSIDYCVGGAHSPGNTVEVSPFASNTAALGA